MGREMKEREREREGAKDEEKEEEGAEETLGGADRCLLRTVVKPSMPLTSNNYTHSIPRNVRNARVFVVARIHEHVRVF